jgi:hypothetical protein
LIILPVFEGKFFFFFFQKSSIIGPGYSCWGAGIRSQYVG